MSRSVIHTLGNLRQFGINTLTGEACAYGQRTLCDLSAAGVDLVRAFLGLPPGVGLAPNWNSTVGDQPAIASIMLTRQTLWDLALFALFHVADVDCVLVSPDGSLAGHDWADLSPGQQKALANLGNQAGYRLHRNHRKGCGAPIDGDRCIHQMSGRSQ